MNSIGISGFFKKKKISFWLIAGRNSFGEDWVIFVVHAV